MEWKDHLREFEKMRDSTRSSSRSETRARYATGGSVRRKMKDLASEGRYGDTQLAHIGERTYHLLDKIIHGGHKEINPRTGLREYGNTPSTPNTNAPRVPNTNAPNPQEFKDKDTRNLDFEKTANNDENDEKKQEEKIQEPLSKREAELPNYENRFQQLGGRCYAHAAAHHAKYAMEHGLYDPGRKEAYEKYRDQNIKALNTQATANKNNLFNPEVRAYTDFITQNPLGNPESLTYSPGTFEKGGQTEDVLKEDAIPYEKHGKSFFPSVWQTVTGIRDEKSPLPEIAYNALDQGHGVTLGGKVNYGPYGPQGASHAFNISRMHLYNPGENIKETDPDRESSIPLRDREGSVDIVDSNNYSTGRKIKDKQDNTIGEHTGKWRGVISKSGQLRLDEGSQNRATEKMMKAYSEPNKEYDKEKPPPFFDFNDPLSDLVDVDLKGIKASQQKAQAIKKIAANKNK